MFYHIAKVLIELCDDIKLVNRITIKNRANQEYLWGVFDLESEHIHITTEQKIPRKMQSSENSGEQKVSTELYLSNLA